MYLSRTALTLMFAVNTASALPRCQPGRDCKNIEVRNHDKHHFALDGNQVEDSTGAFTTPLHSQNSIFAPPGKSIPLSQGRSECLEGEEPSMDNIPHSPTGHNEMQNTIDSDSNRKNGPVPVEPKMWFTRKVRKVVKSFGQGQLHKEHKDGKPIQAGQDKSLPEVSLGNTNGVWHALDMEQNQSSGHRSTGIAGPITIRRSHASSIHHPEASEAKELATTAEGYMERVATPLKNEETPRPRMVKSQDTEQQLGNRMLMGISVITQKQKGKGGNGQGSEQLRQHPKGDKERVYDQQQHNQEEQQAIFRQEKAAGHDA
ncbi:hypothetical protein VTI74DRAFT_10186 [Chaetomium olivicolor]